MYLQLCQEPSCVGLLLSPLSIGEQQLHQRNRPIVIAPNKLQFFCVFSSAADSNRFAADHGIADRRNEQNKSLI